MKKKLLQGVVVVLLIIVAAALSVGDHDQEEGVVANGFMVDVFHRNSPLSPFYDPALNETEILLKDMLRSPAARFTPTGKSSTIIYPGGFGGYVMRMYVGTPPIEQILAIDTGSSLVWIQCEPCESCFKQDVQMFNKTQSKSYAVLPCNSDICDFYQLFTNCRDPIKKYCSYYFSYLDTSYTAGELAMESVGLNEDQTKTILIGCGNLNQGLFFPDESGVCGLGPANSSLVSQLMGQNGIFSYCLPPPASQIPGKLTFQSESSIYNKPGVTSTVLIHSLDTGYYYTELEGISIKDDPELVDPGDDYERLAVDSGTATSWLYTDLYNRVETKVIKSVSKAPMDSPPHPFKLCYSQLSFGELPDLTLHFSGGGTLRLPVTQLWVYWGQGDTLCFMIRPHTDLMNILGSRQQVNMKVEYNVQGNIVSFQPKDCGVGDA